MKVSHNEYVANHVVSESCVTCRQRWKGHCPPSADEGLMRKGLQNQTASMFQSGVSTQPLEERRLEMNATDRKSVV